MKKVIAVLCAAIMVLSLAACSNKQEESSSVPQPTQDAATENPDSGSISEPVTLRFAWWGAQERNDITMKIIEMYKEVAPNVTIEIEMAGWGDYWTKLATQAAGDDMPDLIQICDPYLALYASKNQLADMNLLKEYFDDSNIAANVMGAGIINDKTYMIPTGTNALALIYEPAVFEAAGAKMPSIDWTWDDFIESARKIQEHTGGYGASQFESTSDNTFTQFLNSHGYEVLNSDGTALGFDDPQLLIDYFTMELELTKEGVIPGPDVYAQRTIWEESTMVAGETPSIWQYANNIGALQALCEGRDLELGLPPATDLGTAKASQLRASMGFAIAESSANKEEAMKFIDFFTNNVEVQKLEMLERGIPISSAVREAMIPDLNEEQVKMLEYINLVTENCEVAPVAGDMASALSTIFVEVNEKVLFEVSTPEEAAQEYITRAADAFAEQ